VNSVALVDTHGITPEDLKLIRETAAGKSPRKQNSRHETLRHPRGPFAAWTLLFGFSGWGATRWLSAPASSLALILWRSILVLAWRCIFSASCVCRGLPVRPANRSAFGHSPMRRVLPATLPRLSPPCATIRLAHCSLGKAGVLRISCRCSRPRSDGGRTGCSHLMVDAAFERMESPAAAGEMVRLLRVAGSTFDISQAGDCRQFAVHRCCPTNRRKLNIPRGRVRVSDRISSPFLCGVLEPTIVLPAPAVEELPPPG